MPRKMNLIKSVCLGELQSPGVFFYVLDEMDFVGHVDRSTFLVLRDNFRDFILFYLCGRGRKKRNRRKWFAKRRPRNGLLSSERLELKASDMGFWIYQ